MCGRIRIAEEDIPAISKWGPADVGERDALWARFACTRLQHGTLRGEKGRRRVGAQQLNVETSQPQQFIAHVQRCDERAGREQALDESAAPDEWSEAGPSS